MGAAPPIATSPTRTETLAPVVVVGMGDAGRCVADGLEAHGIGYDAVEMDPERFAAANADGYPVAFGDAGDLRLIIAVIKTITDLERIGDEAEKIARMAKLIHDAERMHMPRLEIKHVANLALAMLRKALDAFARLDVKAAQQVVEQDEAVDSEFRSILRQLITFMMEDPRTITRCLEVLFVAKALERIGDHSKNMAEYVIYMVEGRDVRHMRGDTVARATGR